VEPFLSLYIKYRRVIYIYIYTLLLHIYIYIYKDEPATTQALLPSFLVEHKVSMLGTIVSAHNASCGCTTADVSWMRQQQTAYPHHLFAVLDVSQDTVDNNFKVWSLGLLAMNYDRSSTGERADRVSPPVFFEHDLQQVEVSVVTRGQLARVRVTNEHVVDPLDELWDGVEEVTAEPLEDVNDATKFNNDIFSKSIPPDLLRMSLVDAFKTVAQNPSMRFVNGLTCSKHMRFNIYIEIKPSHENINMKNIYIYNIYIDYSVYIYLYTQM
jgi:hypothetical protein